MKTAKRKQSSGFLPQVKVLVLLPFFTLAIYFLLLFFFLPFYIYRMCIGILAKRRDPQITRMLTGLSGSLLRDYDSHEEKPLSTIIVCFKARGPMNYLRYRELFQKQIIEKKDGDQFHFSELQQHYKTFMGYVFLKWDYNFDIENHICLHRPPVRRQDFYKIWEELMTKPFTRGRSPWEVVLIENFLPEDGSSNDMAVLMRIHHGIADGFSVQKMLGCLDETFQQTEHLPQFQITTLQRLLMNFRTAIFGPYDLLLKTVTNNEQYHSLHLPFEKLSKKYFVVESPLMFVENVKQIKRGFGNKVAFTAVLLSIVCGGIRRFLIQNRKPFPKLQSLGIPFVAPVAASDKLENDFLVAPLILPIDLESPHDRVYDIQKQFKTLHKSSISHMLALSIDLLSLLPVDLMRSITRKSVFSTAYSTLPGPTIPLGLGGMRLQEINFTYGTGAASLGLCFSSITYLGKFRMTIFVDQSIVGSREKAEEMIQCITDEYNSLYENIALSKDHVKNE